MTVRIAHRAAPLRWTRWPAPDAVAAREDLLLGVLVGFAGLLEIHSGAVGQHRAVASVCLVGMAAALVFRRRWPLAVLVAVQGLFLAQSLVGVSSNAQLVTLACALVASYSVGAHAGRRAAWLGLLLGLASVTAIVRVDGGQASDHGFGALVVAGPWLAGVLVRRRGQAAAAADARATATTAAARARARQAAEDERARIARELHDVVSHGLSAMVVQATAAEELLDRDTDRARAAIRQVQISGREAMVEMRHLLGALHPAEGSDRGPQPTLEDVEELVRSEQASGRSVTLEVSGDPRELPRGLALSAYRIVQEALTNVRKHAGAASVVVGVRFAPASLEIEVVDDATPGAGRDHGPGFGLEGMRERARLYDGHVEAGPRADVPGWLVRATFPLEPS